MKAVGASRPLPIDDPQSLVDFELPKPAPGARDLLVRVEAVSVNPVDTKVRSKVAADAAQPHILGYDAAGVVEAIGEAVTLFKPGDEVFYAGDITRPGTNAQFHLVDERIVGEKPKTLDFTHAAALPLTSLTAWELLFERMGIDPDGSDRGKNLLILAGAGGVGSMAIQFAKLAGLNVIATASRPETIDWCRTLGADHVIDHRKPLAESLKALGLASVELIVNFVDTDGYWQQVAEIIAPQGHIGLIVEPKRDVYVGNPIKDKSVGIHWESMFTRARHRTDDMIRQHDILDRVAGLIDAGKIRSTLQKTLSPINAANLREAHRLIESGKSVGKVAVVGW
ncbi:MAG TPA: zinc-binding alcohol dehydrogenase family protein [Rudaea sp.]